MTLSIAHLTAGRGVAGICPAPGRAGAYADDLAVILGWSPSLVVTMTEQAELARIGAVGLPADLSEKEIGWLHLPIADFGVPDGEAALGWPDASRSIQAALAQGGRVLFHCMGGCGRSGMILLRVLCDLGEEPSRAFARLRAVRPCAVETEAQLMWATGASVSDKTGLTIQI